MGNGVNRAIGNTPKRTTGPPGAQWGEICIKTTPPGALQFPGKGQGVYKEEKKILAVFWGTGQKRKCGLGKARSCRLKRGSRIDGEKRSLILEKR